jgi:hypothetical protein
VPHDDPHPDTGQPGSARPDASAARLFSSLQSRAGHAVVIGDDPAAAEALFERVDAQLVCQRRARLSGEGLYVDGMIQALGTDLRGPYCPQEPDAILSLVATEARAAGLPILVVITHAEEAGAVILGQLAALVDAVPDARAAVRFVLLGGPRLEAVLAQPEAQALAARVLTTVRASKREERWAFPLQTPAAESPRRDSAQWIVAGLVALAGLIFFFAPWSGRDEGTRVTSSESAPVWPADAPGTTVPAPKAAPPFPPMTAAPARPAAESPPPPAAAPVPPVAASAPPVAVAPTPPAETPAPTPPVEGTVTPVPSAEPEEYVSAPAEEAPLEEDDAEAAPPRDERPRARPDRRAAVPRERAEHAIAQSLQVGAFQQITNASALAQKLSADFPGVRIVTVVRDGVPYHCVRLTGFADEYAMAARANELRAAGYPAMRVQN